MYNLFILIIVIVCVSIISGCETVKGIGKDLENAGQKIEDAVK